MILRFHLTQKYLLVYFAAQKTNLALTTAFLKGSPEQFDVKKNNKDSILKTKSRHTVETELQGIIAKFYLSQVQPLMSREKWKFSVNSYS